MERKVRVALVGGGGGIGRGSHLPAIAALPQAELVAICDANEEGARAAAAEHGAEAYTDFGRLLAREDVDLVDLASPDFVHAEQAIAAAQAGKHILCEKPMAMSLDEARAMKAAVEAAGVKFMVGQTLRWVPEHQAFREACRRIGDPAFCAFHMKGRFHSYPADSFYRKRESLGQFVHNGMHYVDFMSWCSGSLPRTVFALSTRHYPTEDRLETDNYFVANVTYENGALGVYELNLMMLDPAGFPAEQRWYVVGAEGTAEWSLDCARQVQVFNAGGMSYPRRGTSGSALDPFRGEIGHLCDCILRDEPPQIPIGWSIRVLATCLAVAESAETGQAIDLSLRAPLT